MWPKKKTSECKGDKMIKRLVTGLIIGGAIGSVVGKKLLEKHEDEIHDDSIEEEDNTPD